jgi:protein TonB
MVFPQVLPTARFLETLAPPLPPPAGHLGQVRKTTVRALKAAPWSGVRYQPPSVPAKVYQIVDEPLTTGVVGSTAGPGGGSDTGVVGSILLDLSKNVLAVPPPHVAAPPAPAPPPVPAIHRYVEGGNVQLGTVLHRAEPPYPPIAKAARISGTVELECVVGVDGRIQEVKVKSGNPLLVPAAVDSAWRWIYAPSKLNGAPIEIVTILRFSFKLN